MIQSKILIPGRVTRIVDNKIYIQHGETTEVYNTDYYRAVEAEDEPACTKLS